MRISVKLAVEIIRDYANQDIREYGLMEVTASTWKGKNALKTLCSNLAHKDLRIAMEVLLTEGSVDPAMVYENQVQLEHAKWTRDLIDYLVEQTK